MHVCPTGVLVDDARMADPGEKVMEHLTAAGRVRGCGGEQTKQRLSGQQDK